ncbi:hypothetical protein QN386_15740 [Pseudomonas sp. CCI3.2]|uniref:hypothetical protein n=1 Tax=unclassified Pseudomonas TaxID=196821 RepID=UPI002AC9BBD9|nr:MULTISPECIES: hypothetical protein [unclassified Pseudomonas]MEB0075836.1 hypothetical protein [Pseudomonas sp. MH10out]MEB0102766.1 hypothetical protein [Pseudomonas sp. CCI3.2]MEB0131590.1 hypothetical protein [Pseudomonas sp. CCI2.4]MEB0156483.1 hypothetical protein [Pseudomonas sp. AH2 (2023)]MEB0170106.1 hypothetical protein [Pseudomonas sp. CCC4.4]
MSQVRALNDVGIAKFATWLDNPTGEAPKMLLADDGTTDLVDGGYQIDMSKRFSNSYELGEYLANEVFVGVVDRFALLSNYGMWSWLSLAFNENLVKKGRGLGAGKPLAKPHYIMQSPRLAYRLIARTAWDLVNLHGEASRVALGSSKSPWGEMAEQMTARQEIYAHRSFWPVAYSLYTLPDGSVKTGATSQRKKEARCDPKSKAGLGGIRRLPFTFKQFERTYNLRQMTGAQIAALLPTEYQKWHTGK